MGCSNDRNQVTVRKVRGVTYAQDEGFLLSATEQTRIGDLAARSDRRDNDLRVFPGTAGHHEIIIHNPFMVRFQVMLDSTGSVRVNDVDGSESALTDYYIPDEDFSWIRPVVQRSVGRLIEAFPEAADDFRQPAYGAFTLIRYYLTPGVISRGAHWHDDRSRWMCVTLVEQAPGASPANLLLAPAGTVAKDSMSTNSHTVDPGVRENQAVYFNGERHVHRVKRFDLRHLKRGGLMVQRMVLQQKFKLLS